MTAVIRSRCRSRVPSRPRALPHFQVDTPSSRRGALYDAADDTQADSPKQHIFRCDIGLLPSALFRIVELGDRVRAVSPLD